MTDKPNGMPLMKGEACPVCGQGVLNLVSRAEEFEYKEQRKVMSIERLECSVCQETFVDGHAAAKFEPTLRLWRREVDGLLMPEEIRAIRNQLGVTQAQMAAVVGGGAKAFAKYETGAVNPSRGLDAFLRTIRRRPEVFFELAKQVGVDFTLKPLSVLLVWKNPNTRSRYTIGELTRDEDGYLFHYVLDQPRSLKDPAKYERFDLVSDQDIEYFRITGGRSDSDTLEFLEPITEGEAGGYTVSFPVAGWRYHDGEQALGELREGVTLRLELEPDNPVDPKAVRILSPSGIKLGYVPAIYAWYVDEAVSVGDYEAEVERVGERNDAQGRLTVKLYAKLAAKLPSCVTDYAEFVTV
jgi:putative zinc finger/helix-turn-helix YgiT family protein